jgi:XTP/dITP diphosphohydrolase
MIENKEILFCSSNLNKTKEIQHKIGDSIQIKNLLDVGFTGDIAETEDTFKGNALLKAKFGFDQFGKACFSDDSGLEVEALNNEPGVFSARYAGEPKNDLNNTAKLLKNLEGVNNRKACFKTVLIYIDEKGSSHEFEGRVDGTIIKEQRGSQGFGYDPIFIPDGYDKTFAEMDMEEKSKLSHRARAVEKFITFLKQH